jgi:outer membrane biosynthesis protein TonB
MRKLLYILLLILSLTPRLFAQDDNTQKKNPYDVNFKMVTQQEPYYAEGDKALFTYFYDNIKYSDEAKTKNISGNVMVSFDVMPDSSIANIFVISGVGFGVDEEIVRLLTPLKYVPGIQSGEKVKMNVILTVPVKAQ